MELAPYTKSRRLTRCVTVNRSGEERPRFIESENFNLWQYLVTHKHDLRIVDEVPCLWLASEEFSRNSTIYQHAGEIEPVNRLIIEIFDSEMGVTTAMERFAHRNEVFTLMNILNDHLSEQHTGQGALETAIIPGYTVEKRVIQGSADNTLRPLPRFKPTLI